MIIQSVPNAWAEMSNRYIPILGPGCLWSSVLVPLKRLAISYLKYLLKFYILNPTLTGQYTVSMILHLAGNQLH